MRLSEMPMTEIRREARECARFPCISIVRLETSDIPSDDCFAAFCLVNRDWLPPPRKNNDIIPKTAAIDAAVWVGRGKMREWDRLDAADSGGGMAELGRRQG